MIEESSDGLDMGFLYTKDPETFLDQASFEFVGLSSLACSTDTLYGYVQSFAYRFHLRTSNSAETFHIQLRNLLFSGFKLVI